MFKLKVFIILVVFSCLLVGTSIIKNKTREIERNIYSLKKIVNLKEKDLKESQLDFFYLTSPLIIEKKIEHLDAYKYFPMEYTNIFLNLSNFMDLGKRLAIQEKQNEKKIKKNKRIDKNQASFYFEDYVETNKK